MAAAVATSPLPPAIRRQPQRQLLHHRDGILRQAFPLRLGQTSRFAVANAEEIIEGLRIAFFTGAQSHQLEVHSFGGAEFVGSEANGLFQASRGLREVSLHLPGGAEVGEQGEVCGILALGGAQHVDGSRRFAEAKVQRSQVGGLVGGQLAFLPEFRQLLRFALVLLAERRRRRAGTRRDGDGAKFALIQQKAAPLRRQLGVLLRGVVQSRMQRRPGLESDDDRQEKKEDAHNGPFTER
jgi:hypothetical protein